MLTDTPTDLVSTRKTPIDHESYSKIARFFEAEPRLAKISDGSWRYLPGLSDESIAKLLQSTVPGVRPRWVAFVRRKKGMNLYTKGRGVLKTANTTVDATAVAILKNRVNELEGVVREMKERLDKVWSALN